MIFGVESIVFNACVSGMRCVCEVSDSVSLHPRARGGGSNAEAVNKDAVGRLIQN